MTVSRVSMIPVEQTELERMHKLRLNVRAKVERHLEHGDGCDESWTQGVCVRCDLLADLEVTFGFAYPTRTEQADAVLLEAREVELRRLRDGLDTIDWLLHPDRRSSDPKAAQALTKGEPVKRNVADLVRALLGDDWLDSRGVTRV